MLYRVIGWSVWLAIPVVGWMSLTGKFVSLQLEGTVDLIESITQQLADLIG